MPFITHRALKAREDDLIADCDYSLSWWKAERALRIRYRAAWLSARAGRLSERKVADAFMALFEIEHDTVRRVRDATYLDIESGHRGTYKQGYNDALADVRRALRDHT